MFNSRFIGVGNILIGKIPNLLDVFSEDISVFVCSVFLFVSV